MLGYGILNALFFRAWYITLRMINEKMPQPVAGKYRPRVALDIRDWELRRVAPEIPAIPHQLSYGCSDRHGRSHHRPVDYQPLLRKSGKTKAAASR